MGNNDQIQIVFSAQVGEALAGINQIKKTLQDLNVPLKEVATSAKETQSALEGLYTIMEGFAAIELGKSFYETGMQMQSLEYQMIAATGSTTNAKDAMKFAAEMADKYGISIKDVEGSMAQFAMGAIRGGMSMQQMERDFEGLSTYVRAMHLDTNNLTRGMIAFQEIMGQGTLRSQQMLMLIRDLHISYQMMAQALGMSTEELKTQMEEGLIPAQKAIDALTQLMQKQFGEVAIAASDNLQANLGRLSTQWTELQNSFYQNGGSAAANLAVKALTEFLKELGSYIGDYLGTVLQTIGTIFISLGVVIGGVVERAKEFWSILVGIAQAAPHLGKAIQDALHGNFKQAADDVSEAAQTMTKAWDDAVKKLGENMRILGEKAAKVNHDLWNPKQEPNIDTPIAKPAKAEAPVDKDRLKKWQGELDEQLLAQKLYGQEATAYELKFWQAKLALAKRGTTEYAAIIGKIYNLSKQQHDQEVQRLRQLQGAYQRTFTQIFHSFNDGIKGMLQGTQTFQQAFRNMLLDLLMRFIEFAESLVAHWIAAQLAQTVATAEGAKVRGALQKDYQMKSILADSKATFAGVYANLSPVLGPFAAVPAGAAAAVVFAASAGLPSFDHGAYNLPGDMVAQVHKGETILNATEASSFRKAIDNMSQGGGITYSPNVTFPISAVDGQSVARMLRQQKGTITSIIAAAGRDFNPNMPGKTK